MNHDHEEHRPPFTLVDDEKIYAQYTEFGEEPLPGCVRLVLWILLLIGISLLSFVAYYTVLDRIWRVAS
jgi:hypothetical protein